MNDVNLGKFISLILRHKPEVIGISIDKNGWANVEELLKGINKSGRKIDFDTLERIVNTNNKHRYSFNEDKTLIRANQGHSINVDVELKESIPPDILYHGTGLKYLDSIKENGIVSKNRLHVHLSKDIETAIDVGKRHGTPVVLEINTKQMVDDGIKFYISENGVWLTSNIDSKYFSILDLDINKSSNNVER